MQRRDLGLQPAVLAGAQLAAVASRRALDRGADLLEAPGQPLGLGLRQPALAQAGPDVRAQPVGPRADVAAERGLAARPIGGGDRRRRLGRAGLGGGEAVAGEAGKPGQDGGEGKRRQAHGRLPEPEDESIRREDFSARK